MTFNQLTKTIFGSYGATHKILEFKGMWIVVVPERGRVAEDIFDS
jgi:hypothetical protein